VPTMIRVLAHTLTMVFYYRRVRSHCRTPPPGFCEMARQLACRFLAVRLDSSRGFAPPTSSLCCPQPECGDSAPASRRPGPPVLFTPEEPLQISFRSALEAESPVSMRLSPHTGPPCEIAPARQWTRQRTLAGSPPGLR
jgi:hypothetical protein